MNDLQKEGKTKIPFSEKYGKFRWDSFRAEKKIATFMKRANNCRQFFLDTGEKRRGETLKFWVFLGQRWHNLSFMKFLRASFVPLGTHLHGSSIFGGVGYCRKQKINQR